MLSSLSALMVLALMASPAFGLYDRSSGVVDLTSNNFEGKVKGSDGVWVVEFYAPWCGHCQRLTPEYTKAAKALKGVVKVRASFVVGVQCTIIPVSAWSGEC